MMGQQHKEFAIPFGVLFATSLILIFGFGLEYVLTIPICLYFSVFPDIDQSQYSPRETKKIKALWTTVMWLIPVAAIGILAYYGYRYFNDGYKNYNEIDLKHIGIAIGVLILGFVLNIFKKSKFGKFLWAHRGFTHTLIIPLLLVICYNQLHQMSLTMEAQYQIIIRAVSVLIAGVFAGIVCHIFLDMTCKAGVPVLWPIPFLGLDIRPGRDRGTPVYLHIGNAITSDPKHPGQAHKSSIITTKFWSLVCIILTVVVIFFYRENIFNLFPFK